MPHFGDEDKNRFAETITELLALQLVASGDKGIENAQGTINRKAIGYIYGFIDGALRTIGQDMSDASVGIPITFQIFRRLFPGRESSYVQYLSQHMGTDQMVTLGAMHGGQQYVDFNNNKLAAPMGLARAVLEAGDGIAWDGVK